MTNFHERERRRGTRKTSRTNRANSGANPHRAFLLAGAQWAQPRARSTSTEVSDIIGRWRRRFIQAVGEASASVT
jgi:hypothetical protein